MTPAPTKTVYLRKGLKFRALVGKLRSKGKTKGGRLQYKVFTGPCAVEMTKAQVVAFKDLLQTTPSVLADVPVEETEAEEPEVADGRSEGENSDSEDEDEAEDENKVEAAE